MPRRRLRRFKEVHGFQMSFRRATAEFHMSVSGESEGFQEFDEHFKMSNGHQMVS